MNNSDTFKHVLNLFITDNDKRNGIREVRNSLERSYRELAGCPGDQRDKMPDKVKRHYKHQVCENLSDEMRKKVEAMLWLLAGEGLVILSSGELESLFEGYGIDYAHDSNEWLAKAFEYIANHTRDELKEISAVNLILLAFA